jgi:hypothetical protein
MRMLSVIEPVPIQQRRAIEPDAAAAEQGVDAPADRLAAAPESLDRQTALDVHTSTQRHAPLASARTIAIERRVRRATATGPLSISGAEETSASDSASMPSPPAAPVGPASLATPIATATSGPPLSLTPTAEAARTALLERLNASLTGWVDEAKASQYADRPGDLLLAVASQHHRIVPDAFVETLAPSLLADEALLDETALLYHRLQARAAAPGATAAAVTLPALRTTFLDALRIDYGKRRRLDALFAPSPSLGQTTLYFDGLALRNAEGKSFDELLDLPAVWVDPQLKALTRAQREALLTEKFDDMAESTQFPIGSIAHSMSTALLRIDRYRGVAPTAYADESAVAKAFIQRESAWNDGQSYPYHPRLLFAMHLARSSGFEVVSPDDLRLIYENRVSDPALELLASGNSGPAEWIAQHLSDWEGRGVRWKIAPPAQQADILLGLFDALRRAADGTGPVSELARDIRSKGVLTPNRIVGVDFNARAAAVLEYANERLMADYGAPPAFVRRKAAEDVLRRYGIEEDVITDPRHYVIAGDNPHVTKSAFGDRVDEFLDRADWVGLTGAWMTLRAGVRIKPRDELQAEEDAFNARLHSDPWVIARAKERLRRASKATTQEEVRRVSEEIAKNFATETESHRALVRGLSTWINTVPVAGPIYNIEEGVRHKDAARAAFGLFFLGADGFDLAMSGGGAARGQAIHPMVPKLRRVAGQIDGSTGSPAGRPEAIELSVDPVRIAHPDADVPAECRALARQARENKRVRWRDYDVVHLDEEDRNVPVRRDGERYVEVDWRTGHRLRDAPDIELDTRTGKGWRHRERGAMHDSAIRGVDVRERFTVERVADVMGHANDLKSHDFDAYFADAFALPPASGRERFDAADFYRKLYRSSDTFRRLCNRHAQRDARARNSTAAPWKKWEFVTGDAGPLGAPSKAYTDFDHKRIYMPDDATIQAMPYVTAAGTKTVTCEQAYLHEMIHALTGEHDPVRAIDMLNRGPVVYLTDKVLSEAGYAIPEQIMYRRRNSLDDMPIDQTVEYHADAAARSAARENRYLDPLVDAKRTPVKANTIVEGVPVASRTTVARTKEVLASVEGRHDDAFLAWGDFKGKFDKNFGFYVQDRSMTTALASDATVVVDFYGRLYQRSATFRRMFDKMPVTDASQADPWKFVLEGDLEFDAMSPGGRAHGVSPPSKKIYVLDDGAAYLTELGLREVEVERKLAYQMICAMTGLSTLSPTQALSNRGAAVFLTDRILKEAGFNYPRQLVAALAAPVDPAAQAQLLAQQTAAMRSAAVEDRYLLLG